MAKNNEMIQQITDKIAAFLAKTVKTIRKMDRRMLIMVSAAAVLVIIIFALIINGLTSDKDNKDPVDSQNNIVHVDEPSTDENILPVQLNGSGTYRVETGSTAELNMRIAADKESDVVTRIPNGTQLEVMFIDDTDVAEGEPGWGYVSYNGEKGWVFMEYLKK